MFNDYRTLLFPVESYYYHSRDTANKQGYTTTTTNSYCRTGMPISKDTTTKTEMPINKDTTTKTGVPISSGTGMPINSVTTTKV